MPLSAEQLLERFNARQPPTGRLFNMQVLAVDTEAQSVRMSFEPGEFNQPARHNSGWNCDSNA